MIQVERSFPPPRSLREQDDYDTPEVRRRLWEDARGKCYLCERRVELSDFQIDHRKPKGPGEFPELKQAWRNLFCCCTKCNALRPRTWPASGLLSPDQHDDNVEQRLVQYIEDDGDPRFLAADSEDEAAKNTADELARVHGRDKRLRAQDIKDALGTLLNKAYQIRQRLWVLQARAQDGSGDFSRLEQELRRCVSRNSPYTALIRSRFVEDSFVVGLFD